MVSALNDNLNGNILTYNESEDAYYIQHGADAVPKKLGSGSGDNVLTLSVQGTYTTLGFLTAKLNTNIYKTIRFVSGSPYGINISDANGQNSINISSITSNTNPYAFSDLIGSSYGEDNWKRITLSMSSYNGVTVEVY